MPAISIIVPVYNTEKYLRRCIDSILAQTFTDFELILIDDGSPDNCGKICDEYARRDNRIHVIHQENGGLSAARNAGIDWAFANSDSEWLTFIDSDDWVHVDFLISLYHLAKFSHSHISRCYLSTASNDINNDDGEYARVKVELPEKAYITKTCDMSACGKLYQKELFKNIRYPIGKLHEDAFTTYRVLFSVDRISTLEKCMYFCEMNMNSITRSNWTPRRLDELCAYEEQILFFKKNGLLDVYNRIALGYMHVIEKQYKEVQNSTLSRGNILYFSFLLSQKMKIALIKYKKCSGISIQSEPGVFEVAYPYEMIVYWLFIAVKKKLMK